ncbi:hypothetical protein OESDEN_17821 [Oesophagostomum dentatum]|uniref:Uncharacterized protein n=1 Tax=Oesophagostomum dentatum TaxID=61180 RepID=A0A0B1SGY8_OESDE|nr:hypothetical protein OESDEN_17821 [Oesophagostomum dentatum]
MLIDLASVFFLGKILRREERDKIRATVKKEVPFSLEYNCRRESQAYMKSIDDVIFREMGGERNTEVKMHSMYGDGVTLEAFLEKALLEWNLHNISRHSEFGCNRHVERVEGTNTRLYEVVCVFA